VELRAARYATLLSIAKVSVGSVLQSGEHFITMVPSDAALQIEADIAAAENGYVHVGDKVAVKFATFPFTRYGLAYGTVRVISPDSFTAQDDERDPTGEPLRAELSRATGPVSRSIAWSCATRHPALPAMVKTPMGIKLAVKRLAVSQSSRLYVRCIAPTRSALHARPDCARLGPGRQPRPR